MVNGNWLKKSLFFGKWDPLSKYFLAHRIWISEILPWDRKFYLTLIILPRLSREGYIHWLYWHSRTRSSSDVIVMFKWRHHIMSHLSVSKYFWEPFSKHKMRYLIVSKNKNPFMVGWNRTKKSIPWDHHLSSLSRVMTNSDPKGRIFFYQSPLILTELVQHNLINVSYLTACYLYQVMMTLHFLMMSLMTPNQHKNKKLLHNR